MAAPLQILFVDDDRYFRSEVSEYLTLFGGFKVTQVSSPREALHAAGLKKFDLVLLDIMMPPGRQFTQVETAGGFKTGLVLAQRLRDLLPDAKLVAFTACRDPEIEAWFTQDDSVGFVSKAETFPDELEEQIRRIFRQGRTAPRALIVHGRDLRALKALKELLTGRFGLDDPIVLAEHPSRGQTVIEKLERLAREAELVFVLATPDDIGSLAADAQQRDPRARQNVVFELGFFLGLLKRSSGRVFLLTTSHTCLPSDLAGLVYVDISNGIEAAVPAIDAELKDWL